MSDTSEDSSQLESSHAGSDNNVCRDFLRGMCERKFCKFKHESRSLSFCHDFQNSTCPRQACKFIHCTPDEVDEYKRSGTMSNQVLVEATRKNQLPGIHPICNSFRKGICRRTHCKYRHISRDEEDAEIMLLIKNHSRPQCVPNTPLVMDVKTAPMFESALIGRSLPQQQFDELEEFGPTTAKRRFISNGIDSPELQGIPGSRAFKGYFPGNPPQVLRGIDARSLMLEEENALLHKQIAQLKKHVSDLTATNEFLLDQNAALRVSGKRNGSVSMPPVTLTNTLSQNTQGQVLRTVAASVATVPVSLATVTTCNPVSVGCSQVSIAPPAQILAPSQQILVTTNQPTQIALANSSQAQLAIAQQNLANNLAAQAQPQLTSQAQQLALATTTQQLTSQAQQLANQQLALATIPQQTQQAAIGNNPQMTLAASTQQAAQQLGQQLTNQAQQQLNQQQQQLNQQLTTQAQQLALAANSTQQQLTSQAQQLALASTALNTTQQLTSQAQQLALANTPQQLAVAANVSQQLALASTSQQLLAQQNLASNQQIELHVGARATQINGITTSQTLAMSNATPPMVSFPIMTHTLPH